MGTPEDTVSAESKQFNTRLPLETIDKIEILRGVASDDDSKLTKTAYIIQLVEQDWASKKEAIKRERVALAISGHNNLLEFMDDLISVGILANDDSVPERREAIVAGLAQLEALNIQLSPGSEAAQ